MRLNAPVQELEDNIQRHMNSPMMHDPFLCGTPCDFNLSHSKQEQGATWNEVGFTIVHKSTSVLTVFQTRGFRATVLYGHCSNLQQNDWTNDRIQSQL